MSNSGHGHLRGPLQAKMSGVLYSEWQYDSPWSLPEVGMVSCIVVSESREKQYLSFSQEFKGLGYFGFPLSTVCVLQEVELP